MCRGVRRILAIKARPGTKGLDIPCFLGLRVGFVGCFEVVTMSGHDISLPVDLGQAFGSINTGKAMKLEGRKRREVLCVKQVCQKGTERI